MQKCIYDVRVFFQVKIAAMVAKSRETIKSCQYFSILSYFLNLRIFYFFFLNMELYGHNSNWYRIKLGGSPCLLGDIMQNIAKIGVFLVVFRGESGASFTKVGLNRNKFQSFRLILPNVNLIVQYLSRNIEISQKL